MALVCSLLAACNCTGMNALAHLFCALKSARDHQQTLYNSEENLSVLINMIFEKHRQEISSARVCPHGPSRFQFLVKQQLGSDLAQK